MPTKYCQFVLIRSESAVLYLLLPLPRLLPSVGTQAVRPLARHQVEETSLVRLLGSPGWDPDWLGHSLHLQHISNMLPLSSPVSPRSAR